MTKIYQVIKFIDIPYEQHSADVVFTSLELEEAISEAKEIAKEFFFDRYSSKKNKFEPLYNPDFYSLRNLMEAVSIVKNEQYDSRDVMVIEASLGKRMDYYNHENVVKWRVDSDFAFEEYSRMLDKIMERDMEEQLPMEEKIYLWKKYISFPALFNGRKPHNFKMTFWEKIERYKRGADIWAMTKTNQEAVYFDNLILSFSKK